MLLAAGSATVRGDLPWTNAPDYRAAAVNPPHSTRPGFQALTPDATGIHFTNVLPVARHCTNQIYLNGSGVAAGDLDGDGLADLILGGLGGRTTLYRNLGGWRFEDFTARAQANLAGLDVTGVVIADLDGDGDLDLILNTVGQGTHLLANDGTARFSPFAGLSPVNPGHGGSSSALADVDGDGFLDLYIANYRVSTSRDEPHLGFKIGPVEGRPTVLAYGSRPITDPDLVNRFKFSYQPKPDGGATVFHDEQGEPDLFLRNTGSGRMTAVPWTNGVFLDDNGAPLSAPLFDWGLSALFRDLNGDGWPDLYVCNDFSSPDRIWMNDRRGHFRPLPATALRQTSLSTMAVDVADIDRDGFDDIFTADMLSPDRWRRLVQINQANPNMHLFTDMVTRPQSPRNMLQRNRGDGTYEEIAQMAQLEASEWSWASVFLDVDLDGFEDLLVANGFERDFMNMDAHRRVRAAQARLPRGAPPSARLALNRLYPRLATPNLAFRNLGNLRFANVSREWGFDVAAVSQGMALADLDNDGDLDVVINNLNGPATVLRNETAAPRLAIRLRGRAPNTRGIGARIEVRGGPVPRQSQEMIAGGRYLSSDDPIRVFAAGTLTNRLTAEVRWRSGHHTVVTNLAPNHLYEIVEPAPPPQVSTPAPASASTPTLLVDATGNLNHRHEPAPSDDFASQSMLPLRLSALGPGVAWLDLNGDGRVDLLLPDTPEQAVAIFENDGRGGFTRRPLSARLTAPAPSVVSGSMVGWRSSDGVSHLLAGLRPASSAPGTNFPVALILALPATGNPPAAILPPSDSATGPLALADIDGDGDLDAFVGGRFAPGRWPEPASSTILLQQPDGTWTRDPANSNLLSRIGLVSGAVFTDFDEDGDPDLALATDWGSIRILRNDRGTLTPIDWPVTFAPGAGALPHITRLSQLTGWWTGIHAGDFDGDGRMDLVVGNWGHNSAYERFLARPIRVYYGPIAGDESVGILECAYDPDLGQYAPLRDVWTLSKSLPWLLARFDGYEKFARANAPEALGEHLAAARFIEAASADSTVLLNRGHQFMARPLPREVQVAPVFGVCVADFDGDGREDLFAAQNFFAVRPEASRLDAGRGLILRGDGQGGFAPLPATASGLSSDGEQRGAAVGDYDHDGRPDLVVTQYGGPTRLWRNQGAKPGLRVRLQGPPGNPQGIGAVLRAGDGRTWGPARELHAGSGYWSQDSAVTVLARGTNTTQMQIRWPGGQITVTPVAANQTDITAAHP